MPIVHSVVYICNTLHALFHHTNETMVYSQFLKNEHKYYSLLYCRVGISNTQAKNCKPHKTSHQLNNLLLGYMLLSHKLLSSNEG